MSFSERSGRNGELDDANGPGHERRLPANGDGAAGGIEANGTVRLRQRGSACGHDFVWQKQ